MQANEKRPGKNPGVNVFSKNDILLLFKPAAAGLLSCPVFQENKLRRRQSHIAVLPPDSVPLS